MRWILALAMMVPVGAGAWDPVNPESPRDGQVTIARVVDVLYVANALGEPVGGGGVRWWVAFDDPGTLAACRTLRGLPDGSPQNVGTYAGRYVHLLEDVLLPLVFFARAHNQPVRVKIRYDGNNGRGCHIVWFQTCADPNNCQPAEN